MMGLCYFWVLFRTFYYNVEGKERHSWFHCTKKLIKKLHIYL